MRLTTRQTVQLHGVIKSRSESERKRLTACCSIRLRLAAISIAMSCATFFPNSRAHVPGRARGCACDPRIISRHPRTPAYREIWLDGERIAGGEEEVVEPLYGKTYLPRKFKIVVAVPPSNDVDIFCDDLGYIAIEDEAWNIAGWNCDCRRRYGHDPWRGGYLSARCRRHGLLRDRRRRQDRRSRRHRAA